MDTLQFCHHGQGMERSKITCGYTHVAEGKLIDYYVDLNNITKGDLKLLRAALEERADKNEEALATSRSFSQCSQGQGERVSDFASSLKQLFKNAFSAEAMTSLVFLQRFLTGLRPDISHQLLLCSRQTTFTAAVKDATDVKYALEFGGKKASIHVIRPTQPTPELSNAAALHQKLDTLTKRLESLEVMIGKPKHLLGLAMARVGAQRPPHWTVLQLWGGRSFTPQLFFKLLWTSPEGGRQVVSPPIIHQPHQGNNSESTCSSVNNSECYSVNTISKNKRSARSLNSNYLVRFGCSNVSGMGGYAP